MSDHYWLREVQLEGGEQRVVFFSHNFEKLGAPRQHKKNVRSPWGKANHCNFSPVAGQ